MVVVVVVVMVIGVVVPVVGSVVITDIVEFVVSKDVVDEKLEISGLETTILSRLRARNEGAAHGVTMNTE